jgi:hypothetical protein
MNTYFKSGSWNVICEVCGRKYKSDQVRKRWDGLIVCEADFEQRHILDFIRAVPDNQQVAYQAPEPTDTFVSISYFDLGEADIGLADFAKADFTQSDL